MISIVNLPGVSYPPGDEWYSPSEPYPEYRHGHVASCPNPVYRMVRDCLSQAGLDRERFGTPDWNPLGQYVRKGGNVFVLANFVQDLLRGQASDDISGKCTHGSVLRAVIDYLLIAVGPHGQVAFGNAPLQNCRWQKVLEQTGAHRAVEFYRNAGNPVEAADLRLFLAEGTGLLGPSAIELRGGENCAEVDLADTSLLDALCGDEMPRFRVTNYNPKRTESFHERGRHVYLIHRRIVEADVILSVPKLKTHEKVGITGAVKGCVGTVGHKDCLAHHRFGAPRQRGDAYPTDLLGLLDLCSYIHDWVYTTPYCRAGRYLRIADRFLQAVRRRVMPASAGAWWGNDTAWRMAVDLARIVRYCKSGKMHAKPVREHLVLVDGVVGGEGSGPLKPRPVRSGVLLFGDNPVSADYVSAILMGFDPSQLPIVTRALSLAKYPLIEELDKTVFSNGHELELGRLDSARCAQFEPPRGWIGHVERIPAPL